MKKIFALVAMALLIVACSDKYDDTGIRTELNALKTRVDALESSVDALRSAIGEGRFVLKVEEFKDPVSGRTTGITVTYTDGTVKHFEITAANEYEGPVISIIQAGNGSLCWAVDGVLIQLADGSYVPVYQTPVFSIDEEGNLWVEIDGEKVQLGEVTSGGATLQDGIFTNIQVEDENIVLTLSDDTKVNIPFAEAFKLNIETTECTFSELAAITIPYTVSAKTNGTEVGVAGYSPKDFNVMVEEAEIVITPLHKKASAVLLAYADSKVGLTSVVPITVEAEGIEIVDTPVSETVDYLAAGNDGVVVANVVSNIAFDVVPVDSWITVTGVKSVAYAITLTLEDNTTGEYREGKVNIVKAGTETVIQTIVIGQNVGDTTVNLGSNGTANCYIVTDAGDYKFAAVKGNSNESVGTVASAALLWETCNNETAPEKNSIISEVSYADGYVRFSTPSVLSAGNALICVKDSDDVILWSWHIWIPATKIVSSTFGGVVSSPMMDRNLGALVAAEAAEAEPTSITYGLYYSWGRKDPFPSPKMATTDPVAYDGPVMTVEESIQNPNVYVKTGSDSVKDWAAESDDTLWGKDKTIYDPCPAGYKVSFRDKTEAFWGGITTATGFEINTTYKWFKVGEPATVFPVPGYIDQGYLEKEGVRAYLWSSYASGTNIAYQMYINSADISVTEQRKSRAGNIRCVVEAPVD